ncbi:AraC family transcriptional regulator [Sulfurovum lithotrophicum]|uniref:AraC family transcriptional regulator n=1 Tax=Sulfurovum lithotrophicum TaxID=206403 RepID=A0A7U4M2S7_9BACT|nr:AraC family transcriptional regulator [Sulfurovum lithotrophicum]AKF25624.1 AraC family transcriptional regulator [Sulfurovum lithotrophicum]
MESFFFNITERRYKVTELFRDKKASMRRVDISNGIVFIESRTYAKREALRLKNLDRMVMIVMVNEGELFIEDHLSDKEEHVSEGNIAIYCSSKQDISFHIPEHEKSDIFVLFIADFFLKRYLSGNRQEPIDFLYGKIQQDLSLEHINTLPIDALTLYSVEKILNITEHDTMQSIRAEQRVIEFMIHRFSLLDIFDEVSDEALALASKAKSVLLSDFVDPPTVEVLAHLCATNTSKLKTVFKKVYKTTIHSYVQKLRLEEANLLLKEEDLTIGEIAKRVGYRHQGHFSKLFFASYGVYPKELIKG